MTMQTISVRSFRANLTEYADRVNRGERFVVLRRGHAVALLRAVNPEERAAQNEISNIPTTTNAKSMSRIMPAELVIISAAPQRTQTALQPQLRQRRRRRLPAPDRCLEQQDDDGSDRHRNVDRTEDCNPSLPIDLNHSTLPLREAQ